MKYPEKIESKTVIEKYGRKVELATFAEPKGDNTYGQSEWLLFSSSKTPVIVFPLTADLKVVAVRQYRYGAGEPVLELPGGLIEEPATDVETAIKELREEAGYAPPINPGLREGKNEGVWFDPCCYGERFKMVVVLNCTKVGEPTEPYITVETYPLWAWYSMCVGQNGGFERVLDSKTLAVSLMVLPYLRELCGKKVAKAVRKAVGLK